jgi:hypothetical protein
LENLVVLGEEGEPRRKQWYATIERLRAILVSDELTREVVYCRYLTEENHSISREARQVILINA